MIDPRKPDFVNTPVAASRPSFAYAPRLNDAATADGPMIVVRATGASNGAVNGSEGPVTTLSRAQAATYAASSRAEAHPKPLVTITTAFYNTGEIFRETARCVLGQSLQAWEWIIVNDGSTDPASLSMLDEFRRIDPRVRVVDHPRNRGLSAARNTGFREARTGNV
jgi:cellulose synthase/poly-beta-1,6-N-acetylglucosamine synthase-like glycosyltransferase